MKCEVFGAPWTEVGPSECALAGLAELKGVWKDAASDFYAKVLAARASNGPKAGPKGIQAFLNREIDRKFAEAGWAGEAGRFRKESTWIRVSFRHQMSCGSDFLDAIRLCANEGVTECFIVAADLRFLRVISPNDAAVLTSFEKLEIQQAQLIGVTEAPIFIGRLTPSSRLPGNVSAMIGAPRARGS